MSPLNFAIITVGPFAVIGSVWAAARIGDWLAERDAERMREYGRRQVELAKAIKAKQEASK